VHRRFSAALTEPNAMHYSKPRHFVDRKDAKCCRRHRSKSAE
jgi:hypothetical protein